MRPQTGPISLLVPLVRHHASMVSMSALVSVRFFFLLYLNIVPKILIRHVSCAGWKMSSPVVLLIRQVITWPVACDIRCLRLSELPHNQTITESSLSFYWKLNKRLYSLHLWSPELVFLIALPSRIPGKGNSVTSRTYKHLIGLISVCRNIPTLYYVQLVQVRQSLIGLCKTRQHV